MLLLFRTRRAGKISGGGGCDETPRIPQILGGGERTLVLVPLLGRRRDIRGSTDKGHMAVHVGRTDGLQFHTIHPPWIFLSWQDHVVSTVAFWESDAVHLGILASKGADRGLGFRHGTIVCQRSLDAHIHPSVCHRCQPRAATPHDGGKGAMIGMALKDRIRGRSDGTRTSRNCLRLRLWRRIKQGRAGIRPDQRLARRCGSRRCVNRVGGIGGDLLPHWRNVFVLGTEDPSTCRIGLTVAVVSVDG
jgi:hypothetical protein